jgi:L-threonylcarbamoyladenylate synthase
MDRSGADEAARVLIESSVVALLKLVPGAFSPSDLRPAIDVLRAGGVVAFPTDTFYGLAVDPMQPAAVQKIFALKGRRQGEALPLIAVSIEDVEQLSGSLTPAEKRLAARFWPGPLSILVPAPARVDAAVHGGTGVLAVRVPAHPVARALAGAFGSPITATSANRSGQRAARRADELTWLDAAVCIIDAGDAPGGAPSTIVDARTEPPRLVREGAVPWDRVLRSLTP